jgi:hypothetical protein
MKEIKVDSYTFHSKKDLNYYIFLKEQKNNGIIRQFDIHFELIDDVLKPVSYTIDDLLLMNK